MFRLPESQSCMGVVRDGDVLLNRSGIGKTVRSGGGKTEEPQSVPRLDTGGGGAAPKALKGIAACWSGNQFCCPFGGSVFVRGTCWDCPRPGMCADVESPATCASVGPPAIGWVPTGALLRMDIDNESFALGGATTLCGIDPVHGRLCADGSCCADIGGIPRDDAPRPAKF